MATKACTKCGRVKDLGKFSRDRSKADRLHGHCRQCRRLEAKRNQP